MPIKPKGRSLPMSVPMIDPEDPSTATLKYNLRPLEAALQTWLAAERRMRQGQWAPSHNAPLIKAIEGYFGEVK